MTDIVAEMKTDILRRLKTEREHRLYKKPHISRIRGITLGFCIAFSVFCIFTLSVFAETSCSPFGWYVKRTGDQTPPPLASEFSFMNKYNAFYLNPTAHDDDKVIYLTFDAGYENGNVEKILTTLDEHGAKGTFFVLDNIIKRDTELIKRMAEGGHTVANHTRSHKDMTKLTDIEDFSKQLTELEDIYREYTGYEMAKFYRPPEGKLSERSLELADKLGYTTVMWSFAYADWDNDKQPNPDEAVERILKNTHNGMIILLHPTSATNAEIMDRLLCEWESMGYRFGSLTELGK